MDEIVAALPEVIEPDSSTIIKGSINLAPVIEVIQLNSTHNYVYSGSLTTPPCDEGVIFIIPNKTFPLSIEQFIWMKKVIKFNSRYTQNAPGKENLLLLPRKCVKSKNHNAKLFDVQ
jgi:carbonic anhydrase